MTGSQIQSTMFVKLFGHFFVCGSFDHRRSLLLPLSLSLSLVDEIRKKERKKSEREKGERKREEVAEWLECL